MTPKPHKTALVVEGGGMRSVFAAGVLHAFGKAGFDPFDLYIGTSAGACNLASHMAGQNDRNFYVLHHYSANPRFISMKRFLTGGHLMDLDWLWHKTITEYRLDLKTIFADPARQLLVTVTDVATGMPRYLIPTEETLEHYLKASCALPLIYRDFPEVDNRLVTDGGVTDAVPVQEAARRGATTIVVIRTRHHGYEKKQSMVTRLSAALFRKHPALCRAILNRAAAYQQSVAFMNNPPAGFRILQIAPDSTFQTRRLTRDRAILAADYKKAIHAGNVFVSAWQKQTAGDLHYQG
ncbi:MAG: patatin family protein [Thermodesulfobacteriota bacterium]|nr:patatin family protein [Thermodesulfobacteriota bacterium]